MNRKDVLAELQTGRKFNFWRSKKAIGQFKSIWSQLFPSKQWLEHVSMVVKHSKRIFNSQSMEEYNKGQVKAKAL